MVRLLLNHPSEGMLTGATIILRQQKALGLETPDKGPLFLLFYTILSRQLIEGDASDPCFFTYFSSLVLSLDIWFMHHTGTGSSC